MAAEYSRQIILDTETTGMFPANGDRIVEIGAVELVNGQKTGNTFHAYVNPVGATMHPDAFKTHNISMEFLADKPLFSQIYDDLHNFCKGAEVLMHNAPFDEKFLNAELERAGKKPFWSIAAKVTDTLKIAQSIYPRKANSLDKLCERLEISNEHRTYHGALLDAELLADVYIKMTEGQAPFIDDTEIAKQPRPPVQFIQNRKPKPPMAVSALDMEAHEKYLDSLEKSTKSTSVWRSAATPKPPSP